MSRLALLAALDAFVPSDPPGGTVVIASDPVVARLGIATGHNTDNAAAALIVAFALLAILRCDPAALSIPEHQRRFFPETKA